MQIMRLIRSHTIDAKSGRLLLYALQTASLNLRHAELKPLARERIVMDSDAMQGTPLGENAWAAEAFENDEEDEDTLDPDEQESLDDDEDDEEEEDENEDPDDDDEDDDNSNEPEDEEEDGPPLYVQSDAVKSTVSTLTVAPLCHVRRVGH